VHRQLIFLVYLFLHSNVEPIGGFWLSHRKISSAAKAKTGMVHAWVGQKVIPINLIVRQNQPLEVKKSSQKAQMT
jgi:hypothetical protein